MYGLKVCVCVRVCVECWPGGADGCCVRVNYGQCHGNTVMADLQGMDCALWVLSRGFSGPRFRPLSSLGTQSPSLPPYLTCPPDPNPVTFSTLTSSLLIPQH